MSSLRCVSHIRTAVDGFSCLPLADVLRARHLDKRMKPGKDVDEWGGSEWEQKTPAESKQEEGLEDLVKKASTFFYENEDFIKIFEAFVEDNAHKIDLSTQEMKLEYTDLYGDYQAIFEKEIQDFIQSQGYTVGQFCERLRQATERDPWSQEAVFGKIMTATADFDIFMCMMREAAEALPPRRTGRGEEEEEDPRPARK